MKKKTVIIIHEIYGITDNLLRLRARLESHGYDVLLPSLYEDNYVGCDEVKSYEKFFSEVGMEKAKSIIDGLVERDDRDEISLVGFSIGATVAWLETTNEKVRRVICVYGTRIRNYLDVDPIAKTDVLLCVEKAIDAQALMNSLVTKENVRVKWIDGEHGFYSKEGFNSDLIHSATEELVRLLRE